MGMLSILNVYEGDVKLNIDITNAAEVFRAGRMIEDMIRRGYLLLIDVGDGSYQRALSFDPKVGEYLIADFDASYASEKSKRGGSEDDGDVDQQEAQETEGRKAEARHPRGRRSYTRRVHVSSTNAVAIAPSAGG